MKGVNYITDKNHKMKAVVIDIKTLEKYEEQIEDLLDVIIVESRKEEASIPFEDAIKILKKKGRL